MDAARILIRVAGEMKIQLIKMVKIGEERCVWKDLDLGHIKRECLLEIQMELSSKHMDM